MRPAPALAAMIAALGMATCARTPPPDQVNVVPPPLIELNESPPPDAEPEASEPPPPSPSEIDPRWVSEEDIPTGSPGDADGDGVGDGADGCPQLAEDRDGFEDEDGCPDLDNDGDGIADVQDQCPMVAEDINGVQDQDGCPESQAGGATAASSGGTASQLLKAREAFKEGVRAYEQGDFAAARKHFEAAYALAPRDPILFNLARTALQQGQRKAACGYYRKWKASPRGNTGPTDPSLDTACP